MLEIGQGQGDYIYVSNCQRITNRYLKREKQPGMLVHTFNSGSLEIEASVSL